MPSIYQSKPVQGTAFVWKGYEHDEGHSELEFADLIQIGFNNGVVISHRAFDDTLHLSGSNGTWIAYPGNVVVIRNDTYEVFRMIDDFQQRYDYVSGGELEAWLPASPEPESSPEYNEPVGGSENGDDSATPSEET